MWWKQCLLRVYQAVPFRGWGQMCRHKRAWAELAAVWWGVSQTCKNPSLLNLHPGKLLRSLPWGLGWPSRLRLRGTRGYTIDSAESSHVGSNPSTSTCPGRITSLSAYLAVERRE